MGNNYRILLESQVCSGVEEDEEVSMIVLNRKAVTYFC